MTDPIHHANWPLATAEGARKQVKTVFARMSLRDKVSWLEEMEQVALRFRLNPVKKKPCDDGNM
jgi:hypothetical protein